jgi:hypothetical protein
MLTFLTCVFLSSISIRSTNPPLGDVEGTFRLRTVDSESAPEARTPFSEAILAMKISDFQVAYGCGSDNEHGCGCAGVRKPKIVSRGCGRGQKEGGEEEQVACELKRTY